MRAMANGILTSTGASTLYTSNDPGFPRGGSISLDVGHADRLACVLSVSGAGASVVIVLQGSLQSKLNTDALWTDTALSATVTTGTQGQIGPVDGDGTIFASWPFYRIKVTFSGVNVVRYCVTGLNA